MHQHSDENHVFSETIKDGDISYKKGHTQDVKSLLRNPHFEKNISRESVLKTKSISLYEAS